MTALNSPSDGRRASAATAAIVLFGGLLGILLSLLIGEPARRLLFDGWQQVSPRPIATDRVAVVLVDPDSLASVGPWPWPRYYLARLTEEIARQQPRAIGFDMIFPEADALNPAQFVALYPELPEAGRSALGALPTMDSTFAKPIAASPVVLGRLGIDGNGSDPAQLMVDPEVTGPAPPRSLRYPQVLTSIAELDDVALGHGMLNGPPDDDGIVRSIPLTVTAGKRVLPGFAADLARIAAGAPTLHWQGDHLRLGDRLIPADRQARMALRFGEFPNAATHSAALVVAGEAPRNAFTGKVVVIGLGAEGSADVVSTPVVTEGYGAFVQAQAVDAILNGAWLSRPAWVVAAEWASGALLVLLVMMAGLHRRRWFAMAATMVVALPLVSWLTFDRGQMLFDPIRPSAMAIGAALALQSLLFVRARAERSRLAAALVEQRVTSARQEGEMEAARTIQLGMVPSAAKLAALDARLDVSGLLSPARSVGGDFYDAVALDGDRVLLVIGDVAGKGIPAALYMALSKGLAKSFLSREGVGLEAAARALNRELLRDADDAMGVTMLMGILNCTNGELAMINAGHENPIVREPGEAARSIALRGGPPLCVCDFRYEQETIILAPGTMVALITDGVTEAQDAGGNLFGSARAVDAVSASSGAGAQDAVHALVKAVRAFEGGAEPSDDLTIMAVGYRV
jgi:adenylate cyclase